MIWSTLSKIVPRSLEYRDLLVYVLDGSWMPDTMH